MKRNSKTIALIPARGGSKGILRKNLRLLGGKPLLAWPIETALSVANIDRVIVTSEDAEILETARAWGAETPFIRPAGLATDKVATLPVLQHALRYLLEKEKYPVENVVLLYPTSPFLPAERISEALALLNTTGCKSVVGVRQIRGLVWKPSANDRYLPFYPKKRVNRQLKPPPLFEEAGNVFFSKAKVLLEKNMIVDPVHTKFIFMDEDELIDIDTPADFVKAIAYLKMQEFGL